MTAGHIEVARCHLELIKEYVLKSCLLLPVKYV